ncbi:hypothetical protein MASR1M46_00900 [Bacteroidales bacterium]
MEVSFKKPLSNYTWLIKQYEMIKSSEKANILEKFIPREDISVVFHFGNPPVMLFPDYGQLPPYFIAPVVLKPQHMRVSDRNISFIVTCKPSVFSRIFNINLQVCKYSYIELPAIPFEALWRQLSIYNNLEKWIKCFESFIDGFQSSEYEEDYIDILYDRIVAKDNNQAISKIEMEFPVSQRTLQRQFIRRVGTSPKRLERINRINRVWDLIQSDKNIDYLNLVINGNYYDQSHFIKEFKDIVGETPDHFFKRDLENVKKLSGKTEAYK